MSQNVLDAKRRTFLKSRKKKKNLKHEILRFFFLHVTFI